MAELTMAAYRPGRSVLHRLDARFKLSLAVLASAATLHGNLPALAWVGGVLATAALSARVRPAAASGELRCLGILLALVFLARAMATEGEPVVTLALGTITVEGLADGGVVCLRLVLAYLIGALIVATTRSAEIRTAVRWFLKPLPLVPAERIATMLSLMTRFVPLIMEEAARTAEAQRARGVENRRNPVFRLVRLALPLMRRILTASDRLALAMESRCYTEARTWPVLGAGRRDWLVFAGACAALMPAFL
jgi:energy-coupling factor transporter transmembrane protein EcfT